MNGKKKNKEDNKFIILYFRNRYGMNLELEMRFCCDEMKQNYDVSHRLDNSISMSLRAPRVLKSGGWNASIQDCQFIQELTQCPFCEAEIHLEEREIRDLTDFDPPCQFAHCENESTQSAEITVRGFKMKIYNCDRHQGPATSLTERLHSF